MSRGADWLRNQLGAPPAQQQGPVVHGAPPAQYGGGFAAPFPASMGGLGAPQSRAPLGTVVSDPHMLTPELVKANPQVFIDSVPLGAKKLPGVNDAQECPSCGGELLMSNTNYRSGQGRGSVALGRVNQYGQPIHPAPSCVNCGWPVVQFGSLLGDGGQAG